MSSAADSSGRGAGLVPVIVTCVVLLAGLVLVALGPWRLGLVVFGGGLAIAGLCRLLLPVALVGPLQVRSRAFDVTVLLGLGAAIGLLAVIIPSL